jgi:hypothetical protein
VTGLFTHLRAMQFKCRIVINLKALKPTPARLLHELGHATGGENRLSRLIFKRLWYEMNMPVKNWLQSCVALSPVLKLACSLTTKTHAAYIGSWLETLKGDKHAVFAAAKDASKAVDYLLEKSLVVEVDKDVGLVPDEVQVEPVKEAVLKPSKARTKKVVKPETELEI